MPRDIGTSSGVKLTETGRRSAFERFWVISGVCRCPPPTPYALTLPITSLPSRCGLAALPAPLVPEAATTTSSGSHQLLGDGGQQGERGDGRVAAGHRDPGGAAQQVALAREARAGRRARCRRGCRRRTCSHSAGSSSRKSAPQSMTTVSSGSCAATSAGLAVRQAEEDDVVAGEGLRRWSPRAPGRRAAPGAAAGRRGAGRRWSRR